MCGPVKSTRGVVRHPSGVPGNDVNITINTTRSATVLKDISECIAEGSASESNCRYCLVLSNPKFPDMRIEYNICLPCERQLNIFMTLNPEKKRSRFAEAIVRCMVLVEMLCILIKCHRNIFKWLDLQWFNTGSVIAW